MALAPGPILATTTVTVVLAFVAALTFSHFRLVTVDEQAFSISENGTPSIEALADARAELERLVAESYAFVDGTNDHHGDDVVLHSQEGLRRALARYESLPLYPGEGPLRAAAAVGVGSVESALERAVEATSEGNRTAAQRILAKELHPALQRLDATLDELVALNGDGVRRSIIAIQNARISAMHTALIFGAVSTALALLATLLAVRSIRMQSRLRDEHERMLADRASDLESFAGRVAHDLRGPLSAMALRVATAERTEPTRAELSRLFERLHDRIMQMVSLTDGLLDFAVAGTQHQGTASVEEVVAQLTPDLDSDMAGANAQLAVTCTTNAWVACNSGVLVSVLSNLLRNAAKYIVDGPATERRIGLSVSEQHDMIRFEVDDNGPGIPESMLGRIFEPFVRVPGSRRPGAGIGLATAKRLVTASGGRIAVRSTVGRGSCFWFELPRVSPPPGEARPKLVRIR